MHSHPQLPKNDRRNLHTQSRTLILTGVLAAGLGIALLTPSLKVCSQSAPVLKVTLLNTNQVQVAITNGLSTVNYELYRRPTLDVINPWVLHLVGTMGQTNFTVSMGIETTGYILAGVGSDWDQDGVLNGYDAQPSNAAVGVLMLTIDSPASGENLTN